MRVAFLGASAIAVAAAGILARRGHDVVIVDVDRERLDALATGLDCGFLHGDGTRPAVLRELDPEGTDFLICLSGSDQTNLIAGLVGRSLGFGRIVTRIDDPDFEHIAIELGLEDTVVPSRTIGRFLADMVEGRDILEFSAAIKGDAQFFVFVAREEDAGPIEALALPEGARVTHFYRDGDLHVAGPDARLARGDEVVVIAHRKLRGDLEKRWGAANRAS